jgi:P22 coat protein - gene protein 5
MANTLLTVSQITRKAAMVLHQKCNFINSINRQYDEEFGRQGRKIGDTLRVRMPNQYSVRSGLTHTAVDVTEEKVDLPVSNVKGVDLNFTSLELSLSLDDFSERIIEPAMAVLAAGIESDVYTNLYKKVYNIVDGDAAAFAFSHVSSTRQKLTENLAPLDKRTLILTPEHTTKYMNDTKGLFHSGGQIETAYEEGTLGQIMGFKVKESTIFGNHTTGTAAKTTGYLSNGATQSGAAITVDTGTTSFLIGDVITFAGVFSVHPETKVSTGVLQQFVITANSGTSATSLAISPTIVATGPRQNVSNTVADNSAVVKVGAGASELLTGSMGFYRDAFTFATADLPLPQGVDMAARAVVDNISVSMVRDFSISDRSFPCRLDVLYGYAALRPQLACRIHADG